MVGLTSRQVLRRGVGPLAAVALMVAALLGLGPVPVHSVRLDPRRATAVELEGDPAAAMGMARTPSGAGYWIVDADGRVTAFGDARDLGSAPAHLALPIVGMAATPSGAGYWLVAADGGIFSFGDAVFHGSTGAMRLNQPIVGMATTPTGLGYWLVATDGGVFTFGDAVFMGSSGATALAAPVTSMTATSTGDGYWFVATDGEVFSFGRARSSGSATGRPGFGPAVGMAATPDGGGYWLVGADGGVAALGDAVSRGDSAPPLRPAPLPVGARTLDAGDASRPTPARGTVPGHPGRGLPSLVYYPATSPGGDTPARPGPWPVIVFAHGYNRTPTDYATLLQTWAASGYVVVAPYLPGARSDLPGPATEADLGDEPADLSVVVSAVFAAVSQGSWLTGVADLSRIAAAGHSDGAEAVAGVVLNSGYHDGRIAAGVILAGSSLLLTDGSYGTVRNVPVLIAQGSADDINAPADAQHLFAGARAPRVYLSAVEGSHEGPFVDETDQAVAVRAATVDFLDAVFGGGRAPLARLAHDGDRPGLTSLLPDLG
ncbi:MAG: hypothetical protein NVS3B12_01970 [Acidimicrobiales bacterium]